jgi:3-dehydroquinate dehydratase II
MKSVLILNGPNLGMLGSREPEVYGSLSLADIAGLVEAQAKNHGFTVDFRQTDSESEIIAWIHSAVISQTPVIINPAAFTHYSYGLRDACAQKTAPMIEVHLSNPHKRESFRRNSVISDVVDGTIAGFGADSYMLALTALVNLQK